jgi:carbon-monoxide dehydrogenase large subunit
MGVRHLGARVHRAEDEALVRGEGHYVDDIKLPGMLHAAFLRADQAHALIRGIDTAAAAPGVHAVLTAADLPDPVGRPMVQTFPAPALLQDLRPEPLAREEVAHVGQPVAMVIADSRALAEDALALISVDYDPLPAVVDIRKAAEPDAPKAHRNAPDNVAARLGAKFGDAGAAFAEAADTVRIADWQHRGGCHAMECRGVVAQVQPATDEITVWSSTQCPYIVRRALAEQFGLPETSIRVIAPDVGGGFGPKAGFYVEEIMVMEAARRLRCPVKWIEDRREHFVATTGQRDSYWELEAAIDAEGRITAVRGQVVADQGAFTPYGLLLPFTMVAPLPGPYAIRNLDVSLAVVHTNTTPNAPVRGAGRPNAAYAMERLVEAVARRTGLPSYEIRRRNYVPRDAFPWETGAKNRTGAPVVYDSGDFEGCLDKAMDLADMAGFPERQRAARAEGRYLGIGVSSCIEDTGNPPYEGATVRVDSSGKVFVETGAASQGQGHRTVIAQVVADELGVAFEDVRVELGDTARFPQGAGTVASRVGVNVGTSSHAAATDVRRKAIALAARVLQMPEDALELADGAVRAPGESNAFVTLADLATRLSPLVGGSVPAGFTPVLSATSYAAPQGMPHASGTNIAEVEVNLGTGDVKILRYSVAHDCGKMMNPMIVDGQIIGGVVHGIGNALFEQMMYDDSGQPQTTNYGEYLLPLATEMPRIDIVHQETPSPTNPLGLKGAGEGGTIPAAAAVVAAIEDALRDFGVVIDRYPVTPERLCELIDAGQPPAAAAE